MLCWDLKVTVSRKEGLLVLCNKTFLQSTQSDTSFLTSTISVLAYSLHSPLLEFLRKMRSLAEGDLPRASQRRLSQEKEHSRRGGELGSITEVSNVGSFSPLPGTEL